jgi:hypothetical protein
MRVVWLVVPLSPWSVEVEKHCFLGSNSYSIVEQRVTVEMQSNNPQHPISTHITHHGKFPGRLRKAQTSQEKLPVRFILG